MRETLAWEKEQKAIPSEDNGWLLIRPFFLKGPDELPKNVAIGENLDSLGDYYVGENRQFEIHAKNDPLFPERKAAFLSELPRLKEALAKPNFSPIATQSMKFESLIPNMIRYRTVSQGLDLLTQEALLQNNPNLALDYVELGMKWAAKDPDYILIGLMIKVSLYKIIISPLEEAIVGGQFDTEQLTRLAQLLESNGLKRQSLAPSMKGETLLGERFFKDMSTGAGMSLADLGRSDIFPWITALLPKSYWESERKAYWNLQMGQMDSWLNLTFEKEVNEADLASSFNLGSQVLVPNSARAVRQFAFTHSKIAALKVCIALERIKVENGNYPSSLDALVPDYLPELPFDAMDTKRLDKKSTFKYEKTNRGYLLKSVSSAYQGIRMAETQVYGHDGEFASP